MATIDFNYRKNSTTYSQAFTVKSVRGYSEPDEVEFFPALTHEAVDGTLIEQMTGMRRIITVVFGVLNTAVDRAYIFNFMASQERWITMSPMGTVVLMLEDPSGFANQWKDDHQYERLYTIRLKESVIQTSWPAYADPEETETLYITTHVEITGTPDSPQTLTTNSGALATDDTGSAFPAILLTAYAVSITLNKEQECDCFRTSTISQSGTDIQFSVAHDYAGNTYSDGKYYAQVVIGLEAK